MAAVANPQLHACALRAAPACGPHPIPLKRRPPTSVPSLHTSFKQLLVVPCSSRHSLSGRRQRRLGGAVVAEVYNVELDFNGQTRTLQVPDDENILTAALDAGLSLPHDCRLGVCMTCPAKLVSGQVDQSEGMLSDDVQEQGYALMCASYPRSDCKVRVIPEEELLSLQLATASH